MCLQFFRRVCFACTVLVVASILVGCTRASTPAQVVAKTSTLTIAVSSTTPLPPTTTPIATSTLIPPTNTPASPTNIPAPTNTSSPPTNTPVPTDTPLPPTNTPIPPTNTPKPTPTLEVFNVYTDSDAKDNHFTPSGFMGDVGDVTVSVASTEGPHSGKTAIKITYTAKGQGPNECQYAPPCKWAGVYWQQPAGNWGNVPKAGFPLNGFHRLTFWARSPQGAAVEFGVGGIAGKYPDSIAIARKIGPVSLTDKWQPFDIDLADADLSYVIGGFLWDANWDNNPNGAVFYVDDIRFEK